jgi:hypothetical protein
MHDRRLSYILYNIVLFIFVYLIPLLILLITNTIIYIGLKRMKNKIVHGVKTDLSQKKIEMERRILKSKSLILIENRKQKLFNLKRHYNNSMRFYRYMDIICSCFFYNSISWKRYSTTSIRIIYLCLFC